MGDLAPVSSTHELPFRRICLLVLQSQGVSEIATGWFLGEHLIVTAAHVSTQMPPGPSVTVWPGRLNEGDSYFGNWTSNLKIAVGKAGPYAGIWLPEPIGLNVG